MSRYHSIPGTNNRAFARLFCRCRRPRRQQAAERAAKQRRLFHIASIASFSAISRSISSLLAR